ncbi:MAG: DNA-processing protein DprA [Firmicutes bacterium]|nr:DNA-processing protein DprA [Bacillota bacterium]
MAYTKEQKYWIWLSSVYGLGAKKFDALLDACGEPQKVWENFGGWMEPLLGKRAYDALRAARNIRYAEELFVNLEQCGAAAITRNDPEYPPLLRAIPDPPPSLFVRGRADLADARTLAVVGARGCTAYGTRMARRIGHGLSEAGVTVVSGLARGVDSAAHQGALDARARTIAVLGCGVDVIYPPEHAALVEEILSNGGSVISELLPGTPPVGKHFPVRNRIISGLSQGVLLVEAGAKSGAMSTVTYAQEQGREIMALPGQADSPLSQSTNALIRDGGRLVTSVDEILEDMRWERKIQAAEDARNTAPALPMTQAEQRVYNLLAGGPADTDALVDMAELAPPELNSLLTIMELQGLIRKLPGRKVERIGTMMEE